MSGRNYLLRKLDTDLLTCGYTIWPIVKKTIELSQSPNCVSNVISVVQLLENRLLDDEDD